MKEFHLYISKNRFSSKKELESYIEPTITLEDVIDSVFMKEIALSDYEPMCIERIYKEKPWEIRKLLMRFSYSKQWTSQLDLSRSANVAIAVFPPNIVKTPDNSSIEYLGRFKYEDRA